MAEATTEQQIMRNRESVNTLLRTTTSIGENFVEAVVLLASKGSEHVPAADLTALHGIVGRLVGRAEQTGYIGKDRQ